MDPLEYSKEWTWPQLIQLKALKISQRRPEHSEDLRADVKKGLDWAATEQPHDAIKECSFVIFTALPMAVAVIVAIFSATVVPVYYVLFPPLSLTLFFVATFLYSSWRRNARRTEEPEKPERTNPSVSSRIIKFVWEKSIHSAIGKSALSANQSSLQDPIYVEAALDVLQKHPRFWWSRSVLTFSSTLIVILLVMYVTVDKKYEWRADVGIQGRQSIVQYLGFFLPQRWKPTPYELAWTDPKNYGRYLLQADQSKMSGPHLITQTGLRIASVESALSLSLQCDETEFDGFAVGLEDEVYLGTQQVPAQVPATLLGSRGMWSLGYRFETNREGVEFKLLPSVAEAGALTIEVVASGGRGTASGQVDTQQVLNLPVTVPPLESLPTSTMETWRWYVPSELIGRNTIVEFRDEAGSKDAWAKLQMNSLSIASSAVLIAEEEPEGIDRHMLLFFIGVILVYSILPHGVASFFALKELRKHREELTKSLQAPYKSLWIHEGASERIQIYPDDRSESGRSPSDVHNLTRGGAQRNEAVLILAPLGPSVNNTPESAVPDTPMDRVQPQVAPNVQTEVAPSSAPLAPLTPIGQESTVVDTQSDRLALPPAVPAQMNAGEVLVFVYNRGPEEAEALRRKLSMRLGSASVHVYPENVSGGSKISLDNLLLAIRENGYTTIVMGFAGHVQRDDRMKKLLSELSVDAEVKIYDRSPGAEEQVAAWKQQMNRWRLENVEVNVL